MGTFERNMTPILSNKWQIISLLFEIIIIIYITLILDKIMCDNRQLKVNNTYIYVQTL